MTAAAAALGVSKSTVSTQISRLEARLGSKLMERTSRRLSLTREGDAVLPRAQSLLADAEGLLQEASQARSTPRGIVRIAVSPALGSLVLDRLVPALRLSHPAIALVVVPSYEFGDLQDPAFDFAIRVGHVSD